MSKADLLKGLTPEQIEKARRCHTKKELLEAAKAEGIELTEEQLAQVGGGGMCEPRTKNGFVCPNCQSTDTTGYFDSFLFNSRGGYSCKCNSCGYTFEAK